MPILRHDQVKIIPIESGSATRFRTITGGRCSKPTGAKFTNLSLYSSTPNPDTLYGFDYIKYMNMLAAGYIGTGYIIEPSEPVFCDPDQLGDF